MRLNGEFGLWQSITEKKWWKRLCVCSCVYLLGVFFSSPKRNRSIYAGNIRTRALRSSMNKNGSQAHQKSHVRDCVSIDKNQLDKLRIMIIALGQCTKSTAVQNRINALFSFLFFFLPEYSKYTCWLFRYHLKCPLAVQTNQTYSIYGQY